jgi:hypothetical protein
MRSKIDIVIRINIIDLLFFINTKNIKLIVNLYDKKIKKVYCLTEKNKTIKTTLILGDLVFALAMNHTISDAQKYSSLSSASIKSSCWAI